MDALSIESKLIDQRNLTLQSIIFAQLSNNPFLFIQPLVWLFHGI